MIQRLINDIYFNSNCSNSDSSSHYNNILLFIIIIIPSQCAQHYILTREHAFHIQSFHSTMYVCVFLGTFAMGALVMGGSAYWIRDDH